MAGNDFLQGVTESMQAFRPQAPEVTGGAAAQQAGGGMEEATQFTAVHGQAAQHLQQFVSAAKQGFAAYTGIAAENGQAYQQVTTRYTDEFARLGESS
ncbi:hypothetical protein [Amycolatopsis sp. H20-H5]|uniref:hypothetical protein n=1 Tax=Amycolatopsis sp. H20-H5 TaxID=3046309 RepID=UPI002DBE98F2|nr:hypothetical protein [Amycolatopsis sp. H20-H5]MEC3982624.1 hypothetical protein [Amycolatopsis sp. H20-H5]